MKSATSPDEVKARNDALQEALLRFLDRATPNESEQYGALIAKESYEILEELVNIPGKVNAWTGSKGVQAPFDPPKLIARNQIPFEILPEDITSKKSLPQKFIPSLSAKELVLKNTQGEKQTIKAEIGPYLRTLSGELQR